MKKFEVNKHKQIISWLVVILWMTLIFYLSSQPVYQSNNLSKKITEVIVGTVKKTSPNIDFNIARINYILRKNAHFFAYLVLGLLMMNASRRNGISGTKLVLLSLGICVFYAISDEIHQLFVPGRGGQVKDVLIDSAGAIVGIGVYELVNRLRKMNKV